MTNTAPPPGIEAPPKINPKGFWVYDGGLFLWCG